MIEIKKLDELSENEGFKVLIGTSPLADEIDAFYPDLVPDFSPEDPEFNEKYLIFLDNKKSIIKQLKLLEKIKKKVILVYIDNREIVSALKEYLDDRTRIIRTNIVRTHG